MLDFSFTPEQEQLRRTLRAFALKELLPHYGRGDRERRHLLGRDFAPET